MPVLLQGRRVWVAGHTGMVGAALMRRLAREGAELLTVPHAMLDLRRQSSTEQWIVANRPDFIFVAAAKVGGILANTTYPARFIYDNLTIQSNIIEAARKSGAAKVMLLGSSCIYPRMAPQPIQESALLTGPLEQTNQWYAIAKIGGIMLGQAYRREYGLNVVAVMPTNLYGPADNYHLQNSHVAAAMIRRIHQAKLDGADQITIWGTGSPLREFLYVDDLADACVTVMQDWDSEEPVNIGSGQEVSIAGLARLVAEVVGWEGALEFDTSMPDGAPRKLLDTSKLAGLGWQPSMSLKSGLEFAYADMLARWDVIKAAG